MEMNVSYSGRVIACIGAILLAACSLQSCRKETYIKYLGTEHVKDTLYVPGADISQVVSIQEFGVLAGNSGKSNRANLQRAIDWASETGTALYVTPVENGYPMDAGIVLKQNVSLIGAHGPTGRGTVNSKHNGPTGSLFVITDDSQPFITVESSTRIQGIQFYYPEQGWNDASKIKKYPVTVQMSRAAQVSGVTLRDLTFYGEYSAMDFRSTNRYSAQLLIENCYGYPLGGQFIGVDKCSEGLRISHCHVNPANMREFGRGFNSSVIDAVAKTGKYIYWIDNVDNASFLDLFTFGTYGAAYLGPRTCGRLTNFNFDCVNRGIYRNGASEQAGAWMISQGSIIANVGENIEDVHAVIVDGSGSTSLVGVELFSGANAALTTLSAAYDFLRVEGEGSLAVAMTNCRMYGYRAAEPISVLNPHANVRALSCVDRSGAFFDFEHLPAGGRIASGEECVYDSCEEVSGWSSGCGTVTKQLSDMREGNACITVSGKAVVVFQKRRTMPMDARVSKDRGHLRLSLYISDVSKIDWSKDGAVEITSSGIYDKEELSWKTAAMDLKSGWNEIDLPLKDGVAAGGEIDLAAVNYFRLYQGGAQANVKYCLDNIRFYEE